MGWGGVRDFWNVLGLVWKFGRVEVLDMRMRRFEDTNDAHPS